MRAAVLKEKNRFEIVEVEVKQPNENEVLIKLIACGVCTSELQVWNGYLAKYPYPPGFPGHEPYGEIVKIGKCVDNIKIGDIVSAINFPGRSYAEFLTINSRLVVKVNRKKIILGEPVACVVNALKKVNINKNDNIAIVGCGFMGLLIIKLLQSQGCENIIVISKKDYSLELAKKNSAKVVLKYHPNLKSVIRDHTNGLGADVVIDAAGTQDAIDLSSEIVRIGGKFVIFGFHLGKRIIDLGKWNYKAINIINGHERDDNVYLEGLKDAIDSFDRSAFDFDLITNEFKLEDINLAFKTLNNHPNNFVKGIIKF